MKGQKFIPLLVVAAGLLAYHNSFRGPFIYDDVPSIQTNATIRHLWPIWRALSPPHEGGATVEGRPLINLSLAINYALGGYNVWGYHAANLAIHILAGLTLLGIVRRTLLQPILRERFGVVANGLALATAVLWTVHPLQTESVTYIVQRAESIMGLFYLLTLYCFIRGAESHQPGTWYGLCVIACALGMASKEVMVSAPLLVMLYDRTFLSGSFREAWRRHWLLYVALASTWILLGFMLVSGQLPATTMNAQRLGLTWWQYLLTEPGVILHYLRLSVWPHPLCFDYYGWPIAETWTRILPPALVMLILLGATAWAWKKNSAWGFLSAWFFLILAPSSSVIPLDSPAYEHRMYLPLAAPLLLVVVGLYSLMGRRSIVVFAAVTIGLGFLTGRRNQDYRSELAIWSDTVTRFPNNPRAHNNLGSALKQAGRAQEAIQECEQALRLKPDYAMAHNNLGAALAQVGRREDAIRHYEQALRLRPDLAMAHNNLGNALWQTGKLQDAIGHWELALRLAPDYADAHNNLGNALFQQGKMPEAIAQYEQALRLEPDYAEAHYNLAKALLEAGKVPEAIRRWERALQIKPNYAEAHFNLGVALEQLGRRQEAVGHLEQALRLKPDYAEAHYNLGNDLLQEGKAGDAMWHYEQALRLKPDYAEAHNNLGTALHQTGRIQAAIEHYEQALRIKPDYAEAHYNLGAALRQVGEIEKAIGHYQQALRIKPDYAGAHYDLAVALQQAGKRQEATDHYGQALRLKPDYAEAHNNLGGALLEAGRIQEAIEHYEQAVRLNPGSARVHYNLGVGLEQAGRVPEAMGHYERALQLEPDFAEAQNGLARLRTGR